MEASAVPRAAPTGAALLTSPALLRLASDSHLVALIREGQAAAFETAYDRHHRAILSFCRHLLGDHDEAQDAVQHTFLAAYSDLIASNKPIHLRAWLFTIARNRCYSVLRSRREHPSAELSELATDGLATQVQHRQDLRDLVVDMQRLPEEQRAALVLAELDSLSHQEIAEVLGVPKDKVKALVFQARESLLASRVARETDCAEIRKQLATQRGGSLRRSNLRRHLRECAGCREFRNQVERQHRQLAIVLPVIGTAALKDGVLPIAVGGAGGLVGGGLLASSALKGGVTKLILGALLAAAGTAGGIVAATHIDVFASAPSQPLVHQRPLAAHAPSAAKPGPSGTGAMAARRAGTGAGVLATVGLTRARPLPIASTRHSHGLRATAARHGVRVQESHLAPRSIAPAHSAAVLPTAVHVPPGHRSSSLHARGQGHAHGRGGTAPGHGGQGHSHRAHASGRGPGSHAANAHGHGGAGRGVHGGAGRAAHGGAGGGGHGGHASGHQH